MIFTLVAAILVSLLIVWFVLSPLFSAENMEVFSSSYKGFADENELRQVLGLRDQLLTRLTTGTSSEQRVSELSEGDCLNALVSVCLRLQRAELPYLPEMKTSADKRAAAEGGFARTVCLFWVAAVSLFVFFVGLTPVAFGQSEVVNPHSSATGQSPSTPQSAPALATVESLHVLEPGVFLPTSNRYIISPSQAEVVAMHVSSFAVPAMQSGAFKVVLAVPEGIFDWQIVEIKPENLAKQLTVSNWNGLPALEMPAGVQGLMVAVTGQFKLSAPAGRAVWKNEKIAAFPGEQVAVLFEVPSAFSGLLGSASDSLNLWPPRLASPGPGVQMLRREIRMDPSAPARKVQLVSRSGDGGQPFFRFEVIGLVPSRTPLIVLGALVAAILFGVAMFVFSRGSRWRIDASGTLPR